MSSMHRLQWFDQRIRESQYPNSNDLAAQFEISKRQAQRDIEYMVNSLRAPLLYVAKHRGYIYEDAAYVLPSLYMTDEERSVLRFLADRYNRYDYDNAEPVRRVAHLLDRIAGSEEAASYGALPVFQWNPALLENVIRLSSAIRESRAAEIGYEGERLTIRPYRLLTYYNTDYVAAYCETSGKRRRLRLDSIASVKVTDRLFDPVEAEHGLPDETEPLVRKPFTARIRMTGPQDGSTWGGFTARATDDPDVWTVEFYDPDALLQQLVTARWEAVLSPKWLREKLRARCLDIVKRIDGEG